MKKFDKDAFTFVNNDRVLTDVKLDTKPVGYLKDAWNRFKKNKASVAATVIIIIIALFAIIAPWCTPYEINQYDGYYKQVRPKVSSSAKGFWDGTYSATLNESGYIAMQAIALASLDKDGLGNMTWDEATDYQLNPISKITKTYDVVRSVEGVDVTETFRNAKVDSYYKVGFVNINGLSKQQYQSILQWQEKTGIQVIYPMIDDTDEKVFPKANRGDANAANYWYAMTGNLTPLYPNDPEDLTQGYHEMTLEEVKQKGLWSLYAHDMPRNDDGDVVWFDALGHAVTTEKSEDGKYELFLDEDGNLLYRLNSATRVYTDASGNVVNPLDPGSVFFRDQSNALIGAITQGVMLRNANGVDMITHMDEQGRILYMDLDDNVYFVQKPNGEYEDANGNPLNRLTQGTTVLFVDSSNKLIGSITTVQAIRDLEGRILTRTTMGEDVVYLDPDGNVLYRYVTEGDKRYYTDKDGNVLKLSDAASAVLLRDSSFKAYAMFSYFKGKYNSIDGSLWSQSKSGTVTTVKDAKGAVLFSYDSSTKTYTDKGGNPLNSVSLDATNPNATLFVDDGKQPIGGIFTDITYTDKSGAQLYLTTEGNTDYYRKGNGTLVYTYVRQTNATPYFDAAGNMLTVVPGRNNLCLYGASGALLNVAYPSGNVASYDKDGSLLLSEAVYLDADGQPTTLAAAKYVDARYLDKEGNLVYYYNSRLNTYSDAEGKALESVPAGCVFFADQGHRVLNGLQPPTADELMMVKITTSGEGGIYKDYSVRVLYYNYYQYLNGHKPLFVLGADSQGYDILVRLAHGCRLSLILAVAVSLINLIIGAIYGAIEGYYGGAVDMVMERITDILSGIPFIILVTLFRLHLVETGKVSVLGGLLFAFVVTGWIGTAYSTRMQFYRFKGQEYILAARTLGANDFRLMFKHIFPNALGTLITSSVLVIPGVIFSETSLAYLGIVNFNGANMTSLGTMLNNGQIAGINNFPHIIFFPALILSLLMISFNLFGNGLRDAFNPSLRGTED